MSDILPLRSGAPAGPPAGSPPSWGPPSPPPPPTGAAPAPPPQQPWGAPPQQPWGRPVGPPWPPPPPPGRGLSPTSWALVVGLLVVVLVAGLVASRPWARGAADGPAGSPTSYAFQATDPRTGAPVGFDPCVTEIHYVVRPDGAPSDGDALVAEAFAAASAATGFTFVLDGYTAQGPVEQGPVMWAEQSQPVVVSWSTEAESADLAGDVVGWASSDRATSLQGGEGYRTGQVVLDRVDLADMRRDRDGRADVLGVVMHEVAHLLGLDHVDDPSQLMDQYSMPGVTTYGAGDLAGLAALGTGRCVP